MQQVRCFQMILGRIRQEEASYLFRSQSTRSRFLLSRGFWTKAGGFLLSALFDIALLSEPPAVVALLQAVPAPQPIVLGVIVSGAFGVFTILSMALERRTRNRHNAVQSSLRDFSVVTADAIRNVRNWDIEKICQACCDAAAAVFSAELPKVGDWVRDSFG